MVKGCGIALFLLLAVHLSAYGASQPRPFSGIGVMTVRPFAPDSVAPVVLLLYREPGVGRIGERNVSQLPLLSSVVNAPAGEVPVAVMGKRGEWMSIAYDDAGREGWVEKRRWWSYERWDDYLSGRGASLMPGLAGQYLIVRDAPSESAATVAVLSGGEELVLRNIDGDWALSSFSGITGWIRWRDGDGRLLISVGEKVNQQKR